MKQPPIKTKELSGSTVQIADGQNWEIASITAYGENAQGGTTEAPVALTGVDSAILFGQHAPVNLAKPEALEVKGISVIPNADGSVTVKGTATDETWPRLVKVNIPSAIIAGDITISLSSPASVKMYFQVMTPAGRKESYGLSAGSTSITVKIKSGYTGMHIFLSLLPDQTIDETFHIMIAQGTEPVPFVPYVEPSITPLPIPRPLRRVGDVKDKCVTRQEYESAEKLVVTYNVGFVELDGTENWRGGVDKQKELIMSNFVSATTKKKQFCSHAAFEFNLHGAGFYIVENILVFGANYTGKQLSLDEFKAYLAAQKEAGTPVQVAYQLATPEVYATDPVDFDNAAGPLTVMTGGEVEVTLTHRMLTPYTAWTIQYDSEGEYTGDFFNVEDYDRIKQNIEYLREYAYFLYGGFTLRGMVAVTVESYGYASTIDALDANLEAIAANTFRPPDMMPVKQWRGNQPPPGADDWNRIENTCLLLFEQFERQFACLPKLAFELKGSAF